MRCALRDKNADVIALAAAAAEAAVAAVAAVSDSIRPSHSLRCCSIRQIFHLRAVTICHHF